MTPHDKIKAALEFYGSPYTYQKDMKTGIKDIQNDNGVKADSALALLETHKLVPKDAVVIDDTCGNADQCCFESVSWVIDHLAPMLRPVEPIEGLED